jgi:hypothetical protein
MCVQSVADHADGFPHEALMIRPLLHVHVVCLQVRGRVLARLFTLRWVGGGGSGGQAVERQTKRARGKRNGCCPLLLLSYAYAQHEERGPQTRQNTFQNMQAQVASCGLWVDSRRRANPPGIGANYLRGTSTPAHAADQHSTQPSPQGTQKSTTQPLPTYAARYVHHTAAVLHSHLVTTHPPRSPALAVQECRQPAPLELSAQATNTAPPTPAHASQRPSKPSALQISSQS